MIKGKDPVKRGRSVRQRGHSWERFIANLLKESGLDPTARRNVEESQQASCDIKTDLNFAFQCKCTNNWTPSPTVSMNQAISGALKLQTQERSLSVIPCVLHKTSTQLPLAILRLDDFMALLKLIHNIDPSLIKKKYL